MPEAVINELPQFDLESIPIDWASVEAKEESRGRWSFTVGSRSVGRKIAYEFTKGLGVPFIAQSHLENPKPIDDSRLDGNQISYSEYDEALTSKGDINLVEIYMRYNQDDTEYYGRFSSAINTVLEKIRLAKEKAEKEKEQN